MPSCRKLWGAFPWLLGILLAGCAGVFPWSHSQESRLEHVSAASFDERVLRCDKPVLVDFYAEWCGPCQRLGPVLDEFALEHPEIRVVKVNVDDNHELVQRYGVSSIPQLFLFRGGQATSLPPGFVGKAEIAKLTGIGVR